MNGLKYNLCFTKSSGKWETRDGNIDNFTVKESNNHNYKWEISLNHNSNAQQQNKYQSHQTKAKNIVSKDNTSQKQRDYLHVTT